MKFGPVMFLFAVAGLWVGARLVVLWPEAQIGIAKRTVVWANPLRPSERKSLCFGCSAPQTPARLSLSKPSLVLLLTPQKQGGLRQAQPSRGEGVAGDRLAPRPPLTLLTRPEPSLTASAPIAPPTRFTLSAWSLIRGDGAAGLVAGGQLGGSQAGLRLRYRVTSAVHLAARVSGPLQSRFGKEAALAVDLRPAPSAPVTLSIERRIALDRGGRDAFGIGLFGGFERRLLHRAGIDGYGQAGVVGLKRRDAYVDGALRLEGEVMTGPRLRLGLGAGAWGGAQPRVARLDLGPQLVARLPVATGGIRIGAEWRQRVAGDARPGSGPVLSLGADF